MKVAIYARYSSENQRDASIADQFRICREFAQRQGWKIAKRVLGPRDVRRHTPATRIPGNDGRRAAKEGRHRPGRSARPFQPRPGGHRRPLQAPHVRRREHRHARRGRHHAPAHRPQGDDERDVPEGAGGQDAARPARTHRAWQGRRRRQLRLPHRPPVREWRRLDGRTRGRPRGSSDHSTNLQGLRRGPVAKADREGLESGRPARSPRRPVEPEHNSRQPDARHRHSPQRAVHRAHGLEPPAIPEGSGHR